MKSNPSLDDKIEQFLLGRLPRDEYLEMERAIREQPDLARKVQLRKAEFDTAEELIAGDIRNLFQRLREQEKNDEQPPESRQKKPVRRLIWYYLAAAAFIALLSFLLYDYLNPAPAPPESEQVIPPPDTHPHSPTPGEQQPIIPAPVVQGDTSRRKSLEITPLKLAPDLRRIALAQKYYNGSRKWNETSSIRGNETPGEQDAVDRAVAAWQRDDYRKMLRYIAAIRTGHPRYYTAQLIRAHANFNLGKYEDAAEAARKVRDWKGNPDYSEEAEWLFVLALLAEGRDGTKEFRTATENILKDKRHLSYVDMTNLQNALQNPDGSSEKPNVPIAAADPANFAPNPAMEAFVRAGSRSEGLTVKISSPLNDAVFAPDEKGEVFIRFAGTVESVIAAAFNLNIFDNKNGNKPLLSVPLELKESDRAGIFTFDFQQMLKLAQGLYYFTIERGGDLLYTGKFTLDKPPGN